MNKLQYLSVLVVFAMMTMVGCEGMLNQKPLDETTDQGFWTSGENMKTFAWGFYTHFFKGYADGYSGNKFFTYNGSARVTDNYGYISPPHFARHAPVSSDFVPSGSNTDSWDEGYAWIYKANVFINRIKNSKVNKKVKQKWLGIARFFRAMEYHRMVRSYGAVPYYGHVVRANNKQELYKPRPPRTQVVDSMLADFRYAVKHVPVHTGTPGLTVNKDVILAYMSRVFLFQGTWLKYHHMGKKKEAIKFLKAARSAAKRLIESGRYAITSKYHKLFASLDLSGLVGQGGVILYRKYATGSTTHAMVSYSTYVSQVGISKDALEAYLCKDGLPISLSPLYQGGKTVENIFANRDPRMYATLADSLRLSGAPNTTNSTYSWSSTGIAQYKFVNASIAGTHTGRYLYNTTDAPVMRYGEVLLNYAEADAVLAHMGVGTFSQQDLNISINKLRDRPGINMPHLQVIGGMPAVNGQVYDDPARDPDVPPMIWEIRRERRIELMMEGFRQWDLKRWAKLEYADFSKNPDINRGVWINLEDWPSGVADAYTLTGGTKGYIIPDPNQVSWRNIEPRDYLAPIPLNQISLYKKHGVTLEQNPGW